MFQQQSSPGEPRHPLGGAQRAEGNRPAHNARKATPGSVLSRGAFQGKEDAGDFLGLDQELAAGPQGSAPHELLGQDVSAEDQRGEPGQSSSWLMESDDQELIHIVDEDGDPSSPEVEAREEDDLEPPAESSIVSWRDPEERSTSRRLVGVAAGVIVVGMLGAAGYKLVGISSTPPAAEPAPLAAQGNPLPRAIESMSAPKVDATAAAADLERLAFDESGQATAQPPRTDFTEPPSDPRASFEAARGDAAPAWFDPQQHAAEQAGSDYGYEEPQDAMLQSSAEDAQAEPVQPPFEIPSLSAGGDGVAADSGSEAQAADPQASGAAVAQTDSASPDLIPLSEYLELMRRSQAEASGESTLGPAGGDQGSEVALVPLIIGEPTPGAEPEAPGSDSTLPTGGAEVPADSLAQALDESTTISGQASEVADLAPVGIDPAATAAPEVVPTETHVLEGLAAGSEELPVSDPAPSLASRAQSLVAETPPPSRDPAGAAPAHGALPSLPVEVPVVPGPVAVAALPQPPSVSEVGPLPLPADSQIETSASRPSEVAQFLESRQGRTSTLKIEDVLLAPTLDAGNLRQATSKDLAGIWDPASVPLEHVDHKTKVLTPNVGRVRVVLKTKDIFEGSLYAVGEGSLWLDTQYGRMGLAGTRVDRVEQLDSPPDAPALGAPGSQSFAGMARVRVKTPGGVFYGKVISRDDQTTTLITDDGARITILSKDVELLVDAPRVSIKEEPVAAKKP